MQSGKGSGLVVEFRSPFMPQVALDMPHEAGMGESFRWEGRTYIKHLRLQGSYACGVGCS
jgi:hypothetical protein